MDTQVLALLRWFIYRIVVYIRVRRAALLHRRTERHLVSLVHISSVFVYIGCRGNVAFSDQMPGNVHLHSCEGRWIALCVSGGATWQL